MTLVATTVLQSTDRTFPKSLTRQCCTNGNDHFTGQVELHILKKKKALQIQSPFLSCQPQKSRLWFSRLCSTLSIWEAQHSFCSDLAFYVMFSFFLTFQVFVIT